MKRWKNIQKKAINPAKSSRKKVYFTAENTAKSTNIVYIFEQNDKIFIFTKKVVAIFYLEYYNIK